MPMHRGLLGALFSVAIAFTACGGSITSSVPDGGAGASTGAGGSTGEGGSTGAGASTGEGGSTGAGGSGGASTTIPCAAMGACECLAAAGRCAPQAEACWCPTECFPGAPIDCVCGGGRFLACADQPVLASCTEALAAVQTRCAGQPFVQYIGALCSAAPNPACVAACLANLNSGGSCAEIDCYFCPVCDCAAPATPSAFRACLQTCVPPLPN